MFFKGEQVGSYRRYDERLTLALLRMSTARGTPVLGRYGPQAELHARDFDSLIAAVERGEAVATGAPAPDEPSELAALEQFCSPGLSDAQLMSALQEVGWRE